MVCDFKDKSTTFNGKVIDIPNVGKIPFLMNPVTKSTRDSGLESPLKWMNVNHSGVFLDNLTKNVPHDMGHISS